MEKPIETGDYEVGYGKPPKSTQFKKGFSGNPSGRPKRLPDFASQLLRELDSKLLINENGKQKMVRKSDVVIKQLVNKASKGHTREMQSLLLLYQKALETSAENHQRTLAKATVNLNELTDEQLLEIAMGGPRKSTSDDSEG